VWEEFLMLWVIRASAHEQPHGGKETEEKFHFVYAQDQKHAAMLIQEWLKHIHTYHTSLLQPVQKDSPLATYRCLVTKGEEWIERSFCKRQKRGSLAGSSVFIQNTIYSQLTRFIHYAGRVHSHVFHVRCYVITLHRITLFSPKYASKQSHSMSYQK
jgi:hypothetical protein